MVKNNNIFLENPVNKKYLSKLTKIIFESTGLRVAFRDANSSIYLEEYIKQRYKSNFCKLIWSNTEGRKRCECSDSQGALKSLKARKPVIYECHAGLVDIASAIIFNNKHLGTIYTGEIIVEKQNMNSNERIWELNKDLGIDQDKLIEAYTQVNKISKDKLSTIEQLVKFFTDYFIQSQMLIDSINKHLQEVDKKNELELLLKEANIKEILSKLNPHFIFNTLNIIPWFIRFKKYDEAINVVYDLSKLLRESFGKEYKEKKLPLESEINLVKLYLQIEKYRFGERLNYDFNLEKETLSKKIPRLVLQSIVENCINHGFNNSAVLNISIKSFFKQNAFFLEISDDGKGIPHKKIDKIYDLLKRKEGIKMSSLKNINKLLKLEYGEDFGIFVKSKVNKGTTIIVKIPERN